jgi:hypothetical protein
MGDAGRWGLKPATAGGCLQKNPGGKADFLRLIPEPEDLPGGFFVSSEATPDGKGSSIRGMGLPFFYWFSVFGFQFSVFGKGKKTKTVHHRDTEVTEKGVGA